jgi:regulator of ribonuclease activity B
VQPGDPNPWLVLANTDVVANEERVRWERARFDELAAKYAGDYDGWEAAV